MSRPLALLGALVVVAVAALGLVPSADAQSRRRATGGNGGVTHALGRS